jgi:hypothetical protein
VTLCRIAAELEAVVLHLPQAQRSERVGGFSLRSASRGLALDVKPESQDVKHERPGKEV